MAQSFDLSVRVNEQETEKLHVEIADQDWCYSFSQNRG
jgi:hypothetical protein